MEWLQTLTQVPIVAAFIWFVLKMDERSQAVNEKRDSVWRDFLAAQSMTQANALEKTTGALERVVLKLDEHDTVMRQAITRMEAAAQLRQEFLMSQKKEQARKTRTARDL
jgi:hypothetical protein